jgi:hypothetical protein
MWRKCKNVDEDKRDKQMRKNGTQTYMAETFTMSQAGTARVSKLWKERQNKMPTGQQI